MAFSTSFEPELHVDLGALRHNHARLKALGGAAELAPVLKADAYGLGLERVAPVLWEEGARSFFVARLSEGEALRARLGPRRPARILVLDGCPPGSAARLVGSDLTPVLSGLDQVSTFAAAAAGERRALDAALQIDTGLNRLGLKPDEAEALTASLGALDRLNIDLVISHLACASEPGHVMNGEQLAAFLKCRPLFPQARFSLAASGGIFLGPDYHLDMTRPGISLYGGGPFETPHPDIRAVAAFTAPILQIKTARPGESIGYGACFTAAEAVRIAVLSAGYADGVLRSAAGSGYAMLEGRACRFLGRISMDLLAVDITGAPDARVGDRLEVFGKSLPLDEAARSANTIAYELLTRTASRVKRVYSGEAA